jgi:hypothetical protein
LDSGGWLGLLLGTLLFVTAIALPGLHCSQSAQLVIDASVDWGAALFS